jgi:hypothetical protein
MAHSWESYDHAWANDRGDAFANGDSDEEDTFDEQGEEAGVLLMDFLLALHYGGHLSAKSLCVLSWWASRAGAAGPAGKFAFRPNAPTGHFQRHIDSASGCKLSDLKKSMLTIPVPRYTKHDAGRSVHMLPFRAPHEVLCNEVVSDPGILTKLSALTRDGEWSDSYLEHDVVRNAPGQSVLPCVLYVDGVRTTRRDGVIGFWVYNLISMQRFLVAILRKSELCRCGCRGHCSIWPVLNMLTWSFKAFATQIYPEVDPSQKPWACDAGVRYETAGSQMPCLGALCEIRGDWMEFVSTFGLASWATKTSPCFACFCVKEDMHQYSGLTIESTPWHPVVQADYESHCAVCEKTVSISRAQHAVLKPLLDYDKRKDGALGRSLLKDVAFHGLQKKDRLEPTVTLPDVALFDSLRDFPVNISWWRRENETRVRRRNPVFCDIPGVGLHSIRIDMLHCFYLGVAQDFCAACLWLCITEKIFVQHKTQDETEILSIMQIRQKLWAWYSVQERENPDQQLTRLDDLTVKMLGPRDEPEMKSKGAETKCLIPFCVYLLRQHTEALGSKGRILVKCGEALIGFMDVLKSSPRRMDVESLQRLHDHTLNLILYWDGAGLAFKPKMHLLVHLVHFASWSGNPSYHTTFADEGMNKILADIARSAHRAVFEYRVFAHFNLLCELPAKRRKV